MTQKEKDMNMTQLRVILQYIATAGASFVAGKGWLPQDVATELATWIVAGLPIIIAIWTSRDQGKIAAAAKVEGVKIVAPDAIASAVPAANVVSADTHSVLSSDKSAGVAGK